MNPPALCIIAGAGPGMGLALARRFARGGYAVALLARNPEQLATLCATIEAEGGTAYAYPVDLTDASALQAVLARIASERGPAEVAIHNASLWRASHPMAFDPAQFTQDVALCTTGALVLAQAVYPAMQRAGKGTLLFTGGGLALHPEVGGEVLALTAGKAALRAMVQALAPVLLRDGIHCSTITVDGPIAPGGAFDPDRIAEQFWTVHKQDSSQWQAETVFSGN